MTADLVCTGRMSGKASLESSWTDGEHATGKVHFIGSMQVGPNNKPIEWTSVVLLGLQRRRLRLREALSPDAG